MSDTHPIPRANRRAVRLLTAGVVAALTLLVPGTALAANGGDPAVGSPSCDTQSVSAHNEVQMYDPANGAYMGRAYLNYSSGCKTEWTIVKSVSGYWGDPSIWMQNQTGTNLYKTPTSSLRTAWTYQLASMQYQVGCGGVQMYRDNGSWVSWVYLGCY